MFYLYYSWSYKNVKIVRKQDLRKAFDDFYVFVTPKSIKDRTIFLFLQLIANKKIIGVTIYHAMIDLGESEKVTAVIKLVLIFLLW